MVGSVGDTERRLRVVHVIDSLAGSGGAENRLIDEVLALDGRFDQLVVRLFEDGFLESRLRGAGIPVAALDLRAKQAARNWPMAARRLRSRLRQHGADVVHTSLFTGNLVGQLAAAPLHLPVVSTFNRTGDLDLLRGVRPVTASWRSRVMQAIGRRSAQRGNVHYRAVSRYALETNCTSLGLPFTRATVVPRGVDVGAVGACRRAAVGLPDDVPVFVNVARLVPEKAQHLLVEAFAAVRRELPGARLVVVGASGTAEPTVREEIRRHGVADAVHLLGFRADARELMAAADVFAFSSLAEGSPSVVVEALQLGIPVAAFAISPVAELTDGGRHAWLAPPGSVPELAAAMLAACRAPDRAERMAAGRAFAAGFRLEAVAARLGDLLESRARPATDPGGTSTGAPRARPARYRRRHRPGTTFAGATNDVTHPRRFSGRGAG